MLLLSVQIAAAESSTLANQNEIADPAYSEEPAGFRIEHYRSPVPKLLTGATTVTTAELKTFLNKEHLLAPILIDVFPKTKKPKGWPAGQIWLPEPHQSLPGAIWLPEVGFGTINQAIELAYKAFLRSATESNLSHPIVLFCRENCWISWNAAKRLLQYGYTQIYWYPDGLDGWLNDLNETKVIKPRPLLES